MSLSNAFMRLYLKRSAKKLKKTCLAPLQSQEEVLKLILSQGEKTFWGNEHGLAASHSVEIFQSNVPVHTYDELQPYINKMMKGEANVLWPGVIQQFSKSSGTSSDKSKFIPTSPQYLHSNHIQGSTVSMAQYYANHPDADVFSGRGIIMGGSLSQYDEFPNTKIGDVSALMMDKMPSVAKAFHSPDVQTALIDDWIIKLEKIVADAITRDIRNVSGVPTWVLVLLRKCLEASGKSSLRELWPNFELFIHGGVNFEPYRNEFQQLFPDGIRFQEVYNASEGFFAVQYSPESSDLALLLGHGIFYEFIPLEEYHKGNMNAVPLEGVQTGVHYVILMTNISGLWRYIIGDTIQFTSTHPFLLKITGRISAFINVFGEEVMASNTDKAIAQTCEKIPAIIKEYSVGPIFLTTESKGGHEWVIEFEQQPDDLNAFTILLDQNLQRINGDYEAKRSHNIALQELTIQVAPSGTFEKWLSQKGKLGGQRKVPRLSNSREHIEALQRLF